MEKPQRNEILLSSKGQVPIKLNGTLYWTGYGMEDVSALGLLLKFRICNGQIFYQSRFIEYYNRSQIDIPDNIYYRNGNIIPYGNDLLAINDNGMIIIDKHTLGLKKMITPLYEKTIQTLLHPLFHQPTNATYTIESSKEKYLIIRIDTDLKRSIVAIILATYPTSLIHSFSMTEHYLLFIEYPAQILSNIKSIDDSNCLFHIIHLKSGKYSTRTSDAFFAFHHVNAFEKKAEIHVMLFDQVAVSSAQDMIIMDIIIYKNSSILNLRKNGFPGGQLCRYSLFPNTVHEMDDDDDNLGLDEISVDCYLDLHNVEMPAVNSRFQMKDYNYAYFLQGREVVQFHFPSKQIRGRWRGTGYVPSEVVFVPSGDDESTGTLLTLVYDEILNRSFLLLLNAQCKHSHPFILPELARATTDGITLTSHGLFQT